jgi:hypothetical protein
MGKTRPVWGYPIAWTILEQMYYQPLLQIRSSLTYRSALRGPDEVDTAVDLLYRNKKANQKFVCVDFSAFDASISSELQAKAFGVIASHFQNQHPVCLWM